MKKSYKIKIGDLVYGVSLYTHDRLDKCVGIWGWRCRVEHTVPIDTTYSILKQSTLGSKLLNVMYR